MAYENKRWVTTYPAGADYSGAGEIYHGIALADGQLANTGNEVDGILLNKPKSGEHATIGYMGEMKFAAGGAITKGDRIKVGTSGWFTAAGSGYWVVGTCKETITSGSIGTGLFNFPGRFYAAESRMAD